MGLGLFDDAKLDTKAREAAHRARLAAHEVVEKGVAAQSARLRSVSKTPKSRATRERIMAAASDLMVERGGTDFQMSEVSARCKMSKGSLYYYFSDKDELVKAVFEMYSESLVASIERVVEEAPTAHDALAAVVSEISRRLRSGSPLAIALTRGLTYTGGAMVPLMGSGVSRIAAILAEQIERAKAEGFVREDVPGDLAGSFITGGFLVSLLLGEGAAAGAHATKAADKERLVANLFDLSLNGVAQASAAAPTAPAATQTASAATQTVSAATQTVASTPVAPTAATEEDPSAGEKDA